MDHTKLLIVSADRAAAGTLARPLAESNFHVRVALNGTDALEWLVQGRFQAVILDASLPDLDPFQIAEEIRLKRLPVAMIIAATEEALAKLPDPLPFWIAGLVQIPGEPLILPFQVEQALKESKVRAQNRLLAKSVRRATDLRGLITQGPPMDRIARVAKRLANLQAPVLITGEAGTGRKRIARAIHATSLTSGPLIHVSCKALPEFLLDLELFGHPTDHLDFDGAHGLGAVDAARGGTLLLTDVDLLPARIQAKLIAWYSSNRKAPCAKTGKDGGRKAQVRLIATAGLELVDRVAKGSFKKELYELLTAESIEVPPLRKRSRKHLAKLIRLFAERLKQTGEAVSPISRSEMSRLLERSWPGNLPELRQAVESVVRAAPGDPSLPAPHPGLDEPANSFLNDFHPDEQLNIIVNRVKHQVEKAYICQVMAAYGGRIDRSADHCNLSRKSMGTKVKQHGIDKALFKGQMPAAQSPNMPLPLPGRKKTEAVLEPSEA